MDFCTNVIILLLVSWASLGISTHCLVQLCWIASGFLFLLEQKNRTYFATLTFIMNPWTKIHGNYVDGVSWNSTLTKSQSLVDCSNYCQNLNGTYLKSFCKYKSCPCFWGDMLHIPKKQLLEKWSFPHVKATCSYNNNYQTRCLTVTYVNWYFSFTFIRWNSSVYIF